MGSISGYASTARSMGVTKKGVVSARLVPGCQPPLGGNRTQDGCKCLVVLYRGWHIWIQDTWGQGMMDLGSRTDPHPCFVWR